jgi:hypothetical protein
MSSTGAPLTSAIFRVNAALRIWRKKLPGPLMIGFSSYYPIRSSSVARNGEEAEKYPEMGLFMLPQEPAS